MSERFRPARTGTSERGSRPLKPIDVRNRLVEALRLDLIGPANGSDLEAEVLDTPPSRWYLTGFLVPLEASEAQRVDETADDETFALTPDTDGTDDASTPSRPPRAAPSSRPRWA